MKALAVICNIVLFVFILFVLAVDGAPEELPYIVFTLLALLIPLLTVFAIAWSGTGGLRRMDANVPGTQQVVSPRKVLAGRIALISNVVLLGFVFWAFVEQYPHPPEQGLIAFMVLMALTPIISIVVLFRSRQMTAHTPLV